MLILRMSAMRRELMSKTDGRKLYDPQLAPERRIKDEYTALLESIKGTNSMWRAGEQHFVTCRCGEYVVTSDVFEADRFAVRHWVACK